jgi:hypothetical protein
MITVPDESWYEAEPPFGVAMVSSVAEADWTEPGVSCGCTFAAGAADGGALEAADCGWPFWQAATATASTQRLAARPKSDLVMTFLPIGDDAATLSTASGGGRA